MSHCQSVQNHCDCPCSRVWKRSGLPPSQLDSASRHAVPINNITNHAFSFIMVRLTRSPMINRIAVLVM